MSRYAWTGFVLALCNSIGSAQTSVPKLIKALENDKAAVRLQAAHALGNLGKGAKDATPVLRSLVERERDPQVALNAMKALTQIGANNDLQGLLHHASPLVRQQAIWGLAVIGPSAKKATPDLLRILGDDEPVLRCLAAQALGEIGLDSEAETRALIRLLADRQPEVRSYALMALMNLGPASVPALEKVLDEEEPIEVRTASLQALANQGPHAKSVVPRLIKLLNDPEPVVRAQSAATLAAIGGDAKEALPALLESLLDKDVRVQTFAFQATIAVGQEDRRAFSAGLKSANAKGSWAVAPAGKAEVPKFIKSLSDKDSGTRIAAALALGQIGKDAEPAIAPLVRMLKDDNKQVQSAARQALAQLDQKNAETYFKRLRLEQEQWLREAKIQQAKFAPASAKIVQHAQMELLKANNPQAFLQLRRATTGTQTLSAAVRNGPQQAYLRQIMMMHVVFSAMQVRGKELPPEADWVRDQISETGIEAVPALVETLNLVVTYPPGFV